MKENIKGIAKRLLPLVIQDQIRYLINHPDTVEAWKFKRQFFWNAFKALDFNMINGDYVEFGSHGGMTFKLAFDQIHKRGTRRHMWAFDSFQGFPEASSLKDHHPKWRKGAMATPVDTFHKLCHSHGIPRDAYSVVQGFYEESLMQISNDAPPTNIALAYIDCDMYSSTKTVLEFLMPRLKHGMILAFDDYFCWSSDQISGERKALLDVFTSDKKWNLIRYRDYGWAGVSFIVECSDLL